MTPTKRIFEVSDIHFDAARDVTLFMGTRYNVYEDGSKKVLGFGEQVMNGPQTQEAVMAHAQTLIVPEEVDEVLFSEVTTVGDFNTGKIAATPEVESEKGDETPSVPSPVTTEAPAQSHVDSSSAVDITPQTDPTMHA